MEKESTLPRLRCQRIGCDATFTEDDNPDDSCKYHPSGPIFHDGMKEWSCCKQRSHDFSLFLEIPGCETGKHTTEKPITKAAPKTQKPAPTYSSSSKQTDGTCSRCRQGFFCSEHGSHVSAARPVMSTAPTVTVENQARDTPKPAKKRVPVDELQTCRNKGCGKTFKEIHNHEAACEYHPGPAVFHDRMKGWKCCDVHVKEFDEFMSIPPCSKGWHDSGAE